MFTVLLVAGVVAMADVTPLSEAQQTQVDAAVDGGVLDEGALYPLLQNASAWGELPATPDYGKLAADPGAFRGELFTVQGEFAREQKLPDISRPGKWGDTLAMWTIRVQEGMVINGVKTPDSYVQVIFAADGTSMPAPPKRGAPVTVVARFYKLWRTTTSTGRVESFPAFVSAPSQVRAIDGHTRTGSVSGDGGDFWSSSSGNSSGGGGLKDSTVVLVIVIAAAITFYGVRRLVGKRVRPGRQQQERRDAREMLEEQRRRRSIDEAAEDDEDAADLPKDPAAAMEELLRRHREEGQ